MRNICYFIPIIQLMRSYESDESFPFWDFIPIWKFISKISYEKYGNPIFYNDNHVTASNQFDNQMLCLITANDARYPGCLVCDKSNFQLGRPIFSDNNS
ncbi:hypothetical protein M9Y10_015789 [Tritrichomonas musculus]|uniref:Uncharacterized protein n=1 Tax=Tritrichomonas musculus TaxID=1915356 RepID=A0ABR2I4N4_9EUKA